MIPVTGTHDHETWDEFPGLDKKVVNRTWEAIKGDIGFWNYLEPLATPEEFERIKYLDADVYFVTSRSNGLHVKDQTELWLLERRLSNPTVIITPDKGEACKIIGVTHALEDKAGNAVAIQYMSDAKSYIIDRKYNRFDHNVIGTKVQRVQTVTEFLNKVEEE